MKVVIIGAGQTGRGLIAPIFQKNNYEITFLDKDERLIERMNEEKQYEVSYFENFKDPVIINNFNAISTSNNRAKEIIMEADIVTTSIFANELTNIGDLLKESFDLRDSNKKPIIICVENGVNVKENLAPFDIDAVITEGVIFCTSIDNEENLNVRSEANIALPIDSTPMTEYPQIEDMPLIDDFDSLIQRKIYTYNFISAIVAYLGSYKKYENYSEAARDKEITNVIQLILETHNELMSEKYSISMEEQVEFSNQAIRKFANKEIPDSILRNAQQARRKLEKNERLIVPLNMAIAKNKNLNAYLLVIAATMYYAVINEDTKIEDLLNDFTENTNNNQITEQVKNYYNQIINGENISTILQLT